MTDFVDDFVTPDGRPVITPDQQSFLAPSSLTPDDLLVRVIKELRTKPRPLSESDGRTLGASLEEAARRRLSV